MPINPVTHYQQVLSMALEDRTPGYQDLVSDNNALLAVLRRKGLWRTYSGARIRETLQINKQDAQWYSGWDALENPPIELFNDAYFTPKMVVVPISLTMEEILNNEGEAQIMDTLESYMEAAERSLMDSMDEALHSDGTGDGGKQLTGLRTAVPLVNNAGIYGGISRVDNAIWRPGSYDADTDFPTIGTQVTSTTVRPMWDTVIQARSRGRRGPDLILASPQHYSAYEQSLMAIQRITTQGGLAGLGFTSLQYIGAGRTVEIVRDGGIGSNMPANTTYFLDTDSLRIRYNPQRNFDKLFPGDGQHPINQDAIAQFIGWMGEMTNTNPLYSAVFWDSDTAS